MRKTLIFFSTDDLQHPLIPPYGTPVPYSALYPPGGVYAHPNLATVILISFSLFNIPNFQLYVHLLLL